MKKKKTNNFPNSFFELDDNTNKDILTTCYPIVLLKKFLILFMTKCLERNTILKVIRRFSLLPVKIGRKRLLFLLLAKKLSFYSFLFNFFCMNNFSLRCSTCSQTSRKCKYIITCRYLYIKLFITSSCYSINKFIEITITFK